MVARPPVILAPVRARAAFAGGRLDAMYHCSPGVKANEDMVILKAQGVSFRKVAGPGGMGLVGPISRTKRVYAAPGEPSLPYLRPYDVFDYVPQPADRLSVEGSTGLERLVPEPGTILQTCSGRNLGPLAYVDAFIGRFVVSDDMLRLSIEDADARFYTLAFLSTPTGQALLTRSKTGNVIDHLSADDLAAVEIPFLDDALTREIVAKMGEALALREAARIRLSDLIEQYSQTLPTPSRDGLPRDGWSASATSLGTRVDAAFHDPLVAKIRAEFLNLGGVAVAELAETSIPARYKRYYVTPEHGLPIVSGRQLLQTKPINLRYIAPRSFDFAEYQLGEAMIAFGAEGRAEERIAQPVLVTRDRAVWLANNHVMRVRPRSGVNPGWLFLAFALWQVQAQVKASACGSVVDAVSPLDLDRVVLPPIDEGRGGQASECWQHFAAANELEEEAIAGLEHAILRAAGSTL